MKKDEYISKYGLEAYEAFKERQKAYAKNHLQPGDRHRKNYFHERYLRLKEQKAKEEQGKL